VRFLLTGIFRSGAKLVRDLSDFIPHLSASFQQTNRRRQYLVVVFLIATVVLGPVVLEYDTVLLASDEKPYVGRSYSRLLASRRGAGNHSHRPRMVGAIRAQSEFNAASESGIALPECVRDRVVRKKAIL
jgi:hypothetical protein